MLLTTLQFQQIPEGYDGTITLTIQNTENDENVRNIAQKYRRCVFPDEGKDEGNASVYPRYSYSTCVTDCLKEAQIKACGCTHYNMIMDGNYSFSNMVFVISVKYFIENDPTVSCDYKGLYCLDQMDLMFPQTTVMQPWRANGLVCNCFPSCTEHEINTVRKASK